MGKLVSLSLNPTDAEIKNNLDGTSFWALLQELAFVLGVFSICVYGYFVVKNAMMLEIPKSARSTSASD